MWKLTGFCWANQFSGYLQVPDRKRRSWKYPFNVIIGVSLSWEACREQLTFADSWKCPAQVCYLEGWGPLPVDGAMDVHVPIGIIFYGKQSNLWSLIHPRSTDQILQWCVVWSIIEQLLKREVGQCNASREDGRETKIIEINSLCAPLPSAKGASPGLSQAQSSLSAAPLHSYHSPSIIFFPPSILAAFCGKDASHPTVLPISVKIRQVWMSKFFKGCFLIHTSCPLLPVVFCCTAWGDECLAELQAELFLQGGLYLSSIFGEWSFVLLLNINGGDNPGPFCSLQRWQTVWLIRIHPLLDKKQGLVSQFAQLAAVYLLLYIIYYKPEYSSSWWLVLNWNFQFHETNCQQQ